MLQGFLCPVFVLRLIWNRVDHVLKLHHTTQRCAFQRVTVCAKEQFSPARMKGNYWTSEHGGGGGWHVLPNKAFFQHLIRPTQNKTPPGRTKQKWKIRPPDGSKHRGQWGKKLKKCQKQQFQEQKCLEVSSAPKIKSPVSLGGGSFHEIHPCERCNFFLTFPKYFSHSTSVMSSWFDGDVGRIRL